MSQTNPQIEAQLDALAQLCCQLLCGSGHDIVTRADPLLRSLLMSGYVWKQPGSLQVELERRIRSQCREPAMHRGGQVSSLSMQLSAKFENIARWHSRSPSNDSPPKAANISSATDA